MSTVTVATAPCTTTQASDEISLKAAFLISMIEGFSDNHTYELEELVEHADPRVRTAVAENYNAPYWCLHVLADDADPEVAKAALRLLEAREDEMFDDWDEAEIVDFVKECTSADELMRMGKIESADVQAAVAAHPCIPAAAAEKFALYSDDDATWRALLQNEAVQANVIAHLWERTGYYGTTTRWADDFLAHPNTPLEIVEEFADHWDECIAEEAQEVLNARRIGS